MTDKSSGNASGAWSGRFSEPVSDLVKRYTASVFFDCRMAAQDIRGSLAHARMLAKQGIIGNQDLSDIERGMAQIIGEIERGEFVWTLDGEDVHMNIEQALTERIGAAGAKLHTARSRNDQVNLDFRLYLRDECDALDRLLQEAQRAFVRRARHYLGAVMPGYTHLQRAQPVLLSHHLLAYVEMFGRDRERLVGCRQRINILPLGAAAMAGTGLPIDRQSVAEELGFAAITANSMDTSGDRDFAL